MRLRWWCGLIAVGCLVGAVAGYRLGRGSVDLGVSGTRPPREGVAGAGIGAAEPGPAAVVDALREALAERDRESFAAAVEGVAELGLEELDEALAGAAQIAGREERREALRPLIGRLAELDPDAAIAFVLGLPEREQFEFARALFGAIVDHHGCERALNQYLRHGLGAEGQLGISCLFPLFSRWGHEDIDAAIAATGRIEGGGNRRQMIVSICESSTDPAKRSKLIGWAQGLGDEGERALALGNLVEIWARREGSDAALEWVDAVVESPVVMREIEQGLASITLEDDPTAAAEWLMGRAGEGSRAEHLRFIVSRWAQRAPNAAGEWLGRQPLDASADAAVAQFAEIITRDDPESAFAWASRIHDAGRRSQTGERVMRHWRIVDPEAAGAAIGGIEGD